MDLNPLDLLESLNPTIGEIASLFTGLSKMSPAISNVLLKFMDPAVLTRLATWAHTFTQKLNDLGPPAFDPAFIQKALESANSDDFFAVMKDAKYVGPQITSADLDVASNAITGAIKSENWQQAIQVGLALAKFMPL